MTDVGRVHGHLEALLRCATGADLGETSIASWQQLAQRHRLLPALHSLAVARGVETSLIADAREGAVAVQLGVEAAADAVLCVLRDAGIDVRVVKGLATAHLDYPNPVLRQFGDADLYIEPHTADAALAALQAAGFEHKHPGSLRGSDVRMTHALAIGVDGLEIDLHTRLLHQSMGHLAARLGLLDDPEPLQIAGRPASALPRPVRLIQAAAQNIASDAMGEKWSSDLDVLLLLDFDGVEDEAVERARHVGLGWVVEAGIHRARTLAGYPSEEPRPQTITDRILHAAHGESQTVARAALAEFAVAPMRHKIAMARATIAPGEEYLATRGRSQGEQLRRQFRRMVGRSARR